MIQLEYESMLYVEARSENALRQLFVVCMEKLVLMQQCFAFFILLDSFGPVTRDWEAQDYIF